MQSNYFASFPPRVCVCVRIRIWRISDPQHSELFFSVGFPFRLTRVYVCVCVCVIFEGSFVGGLKGKPRGKPKLILGCYLKKAEPRPRFCRLPWVRTECVIDTVQVDAGEAKRVPEC